MSTKLQIIAILLSAGMFVVVFELVRRRRLMERYALLWLLAAATLLLLSIWGDLLNIIATTAGVAYGPSVLFAVAFGFVMLLLLSFSLVISRLADQTKVLAQRIGELRHELEVERETRTALEAEQARARKARTSDHEPTHVSIER